MGADHSQALIDLIHALAITALKPRSGTHKHGVITLQHPVLLRRQSQIIFAGKQGFNTFKQPGIEQCFHTVTGKQRGHIAFNLLQAIAGIGTTKIKEHGCRLTQQFAGTFKRINGIGKIRLNWIVGNCINFPALGYKCLLERRLEMLKFDVAKRRDAKSCGPVLQQRVVGLCHYLKAQSVKIILSIDRHSHRPGKGRVSAPWTSLTRS